MCDSVSQLSGETMKKQIYTFGYEGLSLEAFIQRLKSTNVNCVVDVRAVPLSRKRGFSKKSFAAALASAGIKYVHLLPMGCPKETRDRYRETGNWNAYTRAFLTYLAGQTSTIRELAVTVMAENCCLVCFEADFDRCHRTFVARAVARISGYSVTHITSQNLIADSVVQVAA